MMSSWLLSFIFFISGGQEFGEINFFLENQHGAMVPISTMSFHCVRAIFKKAVVNISMQGCRV